MWYSSPTLRTRSMSSAEKTLMPAGRAPRSGGSGGFARFGPYSSLMEPVARDESARAKPQGQPPERLGPIARRIVYALALVPIVPAISGIGVALLEHFRGFGAYDGFRWFHFLFSALWIVTTIAIWRRVIVWTLGRKWLTVLVNLIPFVQVVYGQPLWVAPAGGCSNFRLLRDEMLRFGQHEVGIGIWIWLTVWIWWAWEKTHMIDDKVKRRAAPSRMTPTAKRLVASIASIHFRRLTPFMSANLISPSASYSFHVHSRVSSSTRLSVPRPEVL